MSNLRTTDNNCRKNDYTNFIISDDNDFKNLEKIANRKISDLKNESSNFLIFPQSLGEHGDGIKDKSIFELSINKILTTGNIMGFVGKNQTKLTITSRFANEKNDYFLHYMLQKVMSINILDLEQNKNDEDNFYDFLLYFFPFYLKEALNQGLYREYHRNEYNNANVRGSIDVKRHIKLNIPFTGKVAYTMREYVYDNPVMQLVRHTIEYIKVHPFGKQVLNSNSDIVENVNKITFHTQNYNKNNRQKIINFNIKKTVNHPYYSKYKNLQEICIRILQKDKMTFGEQEDQIYGLIFDGAWLWEEYVNTIIKDKFWHPRNRKQKNKNSYPQRLFMQLNENNKEGLIYPDFISKSEQNRIIADAKYKPVDNIYGKDYLQLLAYMFRFNSEKGYYIYPEKEITEPLSEKTLELLEGTDNFGEKSTRRNKKVIVKKIGIKIPQNKNNFGEFCKEIKESEDELKEI